MKIIIIGGGKVGSVIAGQLVNEGHSIVVVDSNKEVLTRISDNIDVMVLCGNGASPEILREAGAADADLLIACTMEDELNALCCVFAKKLGCKNTIARIRSPRYANQMYDFKEDFGLSMTINPELCAAGEIFSLLEIPGALERERFTESGVDITAVPCKEGGVLDGLALSEIPEKLGTRFLICAVKRNGNVVIPDGNFRMQADDRLYVCAPVRKLVEILKFLGENVKKCKDVLIIGAGRMTDYLTGELLHTGVSVKVIERDKERASSLAQKYSKAVVICADGTDENVLETERLRYMDAAVMLTDRDEENLILSMYAKMLGVPQVITKVGHTNFGKLFENAETIKIVNPQHICADLIVSYVRAIQNSEGSPVESMRYIAGNSIAAMEFIISEHCKGINRPLKDLKLKPGILITSITRGDRVIVPSGSNKLLPGDSAIVVAGAENIMLDINEIFAE